MIETTEFYILMMDELDPHSKLHLYEKSKAFVPIFAEILQSIWMKVILLPEPVS